jgi:hypothetical protein
MYRPDKFASAYKTEGGDALWAFLNRDDNILRMETASYLARPAIEPLAPGLLREFDARITQRRIKQMIGHMVRQIMEKRGYHLQQSNVRITRKGNFFTSGSRYVLPEEPV